MKKLLTGLILAGVASSALAVPPTHQQPLLGEAQSAGIVRHDMDRHLAENGFERTPLGNDSAARDRATQDQRFADDGFDRTPLGQLIAEGGSERTGLGTS